MTNKLSDETARELVGLLEFLLEVVISHDSLLSELITGDQYEKFYKITEKAKAELEGE